MITSQGLQSSVICLSPCLHQRTVDCTRAVAALHVPGALDSCWSPDSRLHKPDIKKKHQESNIKKRKKCLTIYYRYVITGLYDTEHWTWFERRHTSLLSAGPRARSYKLFGATFPTASRYLWLVIAFTLSFLDRRTMIYSNHNFTITLKVFGDFITSVYLVAETCMESVCFLSSSFMLSFNQRVNGNPY